MNLNDIYSHLINNELPLNGKWVSSAKNDIYTSIDSLSQLIFQAVEPEKGNLQNLRQINKIEDLINEKYRKTESVNFNQIKSTIINSIAENTLTTLEKITNHTKKNHLLAKSALEGLEEIWNQRNYELLTPTEMSRIGDIERNIIRLIDSKKTKILLSKTSLELNLTKVNNYLNHIESIKNAIENRNLSLLKECIESATFPLNIKIDHSGNTILHLISNWPEAIELLLNKTPSLVDEPNDMYEFPSISMSSKEKNQLQLRPIKSHQKQLLDDENLNSHPNTLMMEINNLILNSNDPFSESVICKKFETHPQVILGQRGRNLLCSAIQSGSFPLVKKLLDLGVSPRGVYGLPLSDAAQATSTPLHQAILNKELPIATLLVERGAEISACDRLGRSIMDLIKSQSSLSSNFKISRWIELSTSRSEELKQSRFKKACESKNWPELIQLIHEGFNPGAEIYHLFSGMIRDHQFYLIKLLIEKDYIPAIQPRMIEEILLIAPPVIVRWLLTTLTEKVFLDLPLLLNTALNAKDFGLAAFLINLGAEPQGKDAEALNHYAEALKKGTKAERGLRELINAKNIGHLVGDTIISQMKDDEGRDLEGNSTRESLEFFRAALNFTIEETKTSSLAVMQVSQALQKASELALRIESIFHLGNDRLIANALELLEADLIDEVNKLPIGESIVIPSGWTSGHRGHAIIVECKRLSQDKLELNVINTGDGINYHGVVYKKARLYTNTVRSHILSNTQLKDLNVLRRVVEPNVFSDIKRRFFPEDIYGFLDPFHTHDKKIPNEIELMPKTRKAQLSGTCSLRCWLAYSKLKFPAEYRLIKEVLCEKVIHFAIEQNLMLFDKQPTLTRLLNLSIPVLFHTLSKNLSTPSADLEQKEKQLIKLTSSSLSLQKAIPEAISENKAFLQAPFFATESNQISVAINSLIESPTPSSLDALYQFFSTLSKKHMALPIRAIPLDINQITSTDILEKYLDDLGKSICIPKANTYDQQHRLIENCLTETLITLGRTFLPDSPNTPLKKALETLKNDPLACKRLIGKIYFLTNTLSETSINRFTDNIAHSIALEYALIASWELSCHIDINLKNYRLDLKNLTTWMHAKNSWDPTLKHSPILNFELENDLQQLFEYQKKEKAKKLPSLLNIDKLEYAIGDFSSPSALNLDLSLANASADFDYAVKAAKTHNNWTLADAQYYLAIAPIKLLNKAPNITLDQWRVHWLYFSGLPNYFHQLRGLAVLANKNKFGRESYSSIASTSTLYLRDTGEEDDKKQTICRPHLHYTFKDKGKPLTNTRNLEVLPKNTNGLVFSSYSLGNKENDLSLTRQHPDHNHIIYEIPNLIDQQLMSIRTTVAPFHDFYNFYYVPVKDEISPLVVPLLLDFFTQHHSELSKLKIRVFFEIAFFSSLCLPRAIKEIPNCANDIKFFFQKTLSYFEDRIALTVEKSSSLEALAFLCTQWQRALTYLQHEGISHIGQESTVNLLKSVRNKIKQLLKDPDFQKNGLQQQLLLGLMDSYHIESLQPVHPQTLVKDVITSIATYYHLATSEEEGNFLTPAFLNSALSIPIKFRKTIHDTLKNNQEFTNSLFNEIAVNYGVKIPKNTPWNIQEFPVYQCQFNQDILEIDVLTGRFLHNGKEITTLYQSMRNASKSYIELFGEKTLTATDCKAYLKASDDLGEIQIFTKHIDDSKQISEIRRKINGKWYTHIPALDIKSHPPLPPLIGKENLSLWICQEDEKHYLLTDRQTLTPTIRLDLDGRLTFLQEDPNLRWECIGSESLKRTPILDLDPSAFMLQEDSKNIPRNLRLIFPNLIDSSGENIQCERRLFPDSAEPRWVIKSKPHLFLSKEQLLPGIRNFNQFLIIENFSGSREALIPLKTKKQIDAKDTVSCSCVSVNLKGNTLSSPDPKANLYLAYLTLIHSKTSEDYEMAMKFLQCARKFESYDEEELRLLGWIFHSQKMTNDGTVHASAIKLFASWLVTENFKRNPDIPSETLTMSSETLEATNPPCDWMMFWREKIPKENLPSQIQELACFYFARQQHLPLGMRMQDVLTTQELIDWKLNQFILEGRSITDTKTDPKVNVTSSDITLINEMELSRRLPEILVPGRPFDSLENEFPALLNAALSQDPQTRALAEKQLAAMRFDPYSKLFSKILGAALHSHKNEDARNVINFVYKIINTPSEKLFNPDTFRSGIRSYSKEEQDNLLYPHLLAQELETLLSKSPDYFSPLRTSEFDLPLSLKADIFPSIQPIVLPSKIPPSNQLLFKPATSLDVPRFERLFHSAFEVVHQDGDIHIKPFEFETEDPWLKQCIENINEDYLAGAEKNHRIPHYKLKEGKLKNLIDHQYPAITQEATHYSEKVITKAQDAILKLANKLPSDKKSSLKHQMESASGRKKLLSIKDCVQLFLRGDLETYQIATSLNEHEIQELDNLIGNYILISTKANRYREVLKCFEKIKKIYESDKYTQTEIEAALQHLAEELKINKSVDPVQDPRAFMVFEYVLNMTLRDHQVEGLREMIKTETGDVSRYRSVLLQRIQGGGKSLVFGHIMAQFKADGYHLSVHIPTTSQYQTSLYDMSARSDELYQQRERTLVFDDDPLKFTEEYLTWIKKMLKGAIVNREYVTLTNETLRALRCKYLKTRFEILKAPPERNVTKLEECNQILKEILILLRSRGIFTFDEVHKAYDPLIELNMPYGLPEKPLNAESRLISQIIILACLPNEQGRIWIDLEHSAQQSKEDFNGMIDQIIEGLLTNPSWNQPGIRDYLSGKVDDVPSFLETGDNEDLMKLIILARQMLAGNWLKERLATNVNEHHGVPLTGFPRVSIPFRANMNPAIGSEFTDPYVMTTNTMIAYLVTGLNEQQARELLEIFRKSAEVEKRGLAEKSHFISLHEAPSSLIFKEITNLDLFRIDREKQEDIQTLQAALLHALKHPEKNKKEAAMNFFFDYIITKEINGVELYENQVCSNGQNVASMCKSFVAYSGSMENLNIAPIGSIAKPERGTNGQTIDLLIRHKTPVKIVKDGNIQSLFKMMSNHPQSQDIHAIMDVGAFFRGQKNEVVAKMICEHLTATHSEIQGVLFFDTKENLCFMQRDVPHTIKKISMTTPEAIKAETGFEKSQLFTYYDQVHITGVDIAQDDHAIGIFTMHEQTPIHEILQAVRRLRKMDQAQRLLAAIPEGVIKNIETILKKSYRSNEFPSIDDLLLYANIIETGSQKGENLIFCLQKMENIFQQYILDKLYELDVHEEGYLFEKCSYLFEKNVTIDLHKEFAHKREGCPMPLYLETIKQTLMQPLIEILSNNELDGLNHLINSELLNEDRLKELDATVSVPHGFSPKERINTSINSNRTSSRVQSKQNVRSNEKMQVSDQENITDFLNQIESLRLLKSHAKKESIFSKQMFFSKDFGHPAADIDIDSSQPVCWSLNSALKLEKTSFPIESQFNDGLVCTSNAASTVKDHINLTGPYRKKSCPLLVICDTGDDGSKKWKVVLCSIKDAVTFDSFLKPKLDGKKWTINSRNNREMWLVRNKGNLIAGSSELDLDNNPELSLMMTQALFLEGDFEALSAEPWKARIMSWFSTLDIKAKKEWIRFFEEEILMGFPPGYKSSYLYDYFHTNSWSRSK